MENIAILTGGDSAEYQISLLSAKTVLKHLNKLKYNGVIVHLKNGEYTIDNKKIDTSDFSYIEKNKKIKFDKVFIALHGPPAENGLIQDYFESIKLPYTSCNSKVSSLTFDKFKCNKRLSEIGFLCANSILIDYDLDFDEESIINNVGLPCFVKPNAAGSSYGISKVIQRRDLTEAIKQAFIHDKKVIIESYVEGIEVSCGVYFDGYKIKALPITEIISENDFFDYDAKYNGKSQEVTPAKIDKNLSLRVQKNSIDIYKKMNLKGICRIDFIIHKENPYIIEINTIPGLSKESIIPQQVEATNISLSGIFDLLLSNIN